MNRISWTSGAKKTRIDKARESPPFGNGQSLLYQLSTAVFRLNPGIITQARLGSSRLPGKVLMEVQGRPLLDYHLERLVCSGLPVVVATSSSPKDDAIEAYCLRRKTECFRGSEEDVLSRFAGCARSRFFDVIVRVTSDCPLIDGELIRRAVNRYLEKGDPGVYLSNVAKRTYPRGFDFEVFSRDLLDEAEARAARPFEREHVTPFIRENRSGGVRLEHVTREEDCSGFRVTVDERPDFELMKLLIAQHGCHRLDAEGIIALLKSLPGISRMNAAVSQRAG